MFDMLGSLFVKEAWAMAPPQGGSASGTDSIMGFLPIIIIFVIFYFLLIRPQQKRQKEIEKMQGELKKGDKVITSGGIYGLVESVGKTTVTLKIADNTKAKFGKAYISAVRSTSEDED